MVTIRRDTELEDRILEKMLEIRDKEKDVLDMRKEVAHLMHDLGTVYLEQSDEVRRVERSAHLTFREAVRMAVERAPGSQPSDIWPVVREMGVTTRNPHPNKAVSMVLHDLKQDGLVENDGNGWHVKVA